MRKSEDSMDVRTLQRGVYVDRCIHLWGKWYSNPGRGEEFRVCSLCGESQIRSVPTEATWDSLGRGYIDWPEPSQTYGADE